MDWRNIMMDSFRQFLAKITTFLPNLLAMMVIILLGLLAAWVVKVLLYRFLKAIQFDKRAEGWGFAPFLSKGLAAYSPAHLLSRLVYWGIILITLIMGINALEIGATRNFVTHFFTYLPHFFAAILILVVGYLISIFFSQAALIAAVNAQIDSARLLSRAVRWFFIILSLAMALYHLGIAEKVVVAAFSIIFGGIVLALAIAFGWGGRDLAKNFLENLSRRKTEEKKDPDRITHI